MFTASYFYATMLKNKLLLIVFAVGLSHYVTCQSFSNQVFNNQIKTIELKNENNPRGLPIINLNSSEQLTLRFDDLDKTVKNYRYTFEHCDHNWKRSDNLFKNDFLSGFEENDIINHEISVNTSVPYIHYSMTFPNQDVTLKLSGNYVLIVYDEDPKNILLTQRFFVADIKTEVVTQPKIPVDYDYRYTHHQIDFTVNYPTIQSDNPLQEFKCVVMQNNRFDNAKYDIKPQFNNGKSLTFQNNPDLNFEAANEYRILDFRDIRPGNSNRNKVIFQDSNYHILPPIDYRRAYKSYATVFDHDGKFFVDLAPRNFDPNISADYNYVHFRLKKEMPYDTASVYMIGGFSYGEVLRDYKMRYNDSLRHYESHLLMKQGVYDYLYAIRGNKTGDLNVEDVDGSHVNTGNIYTVFVYIKRFADNYEQLIGVKRFLYQ